MSAAILTVLSAFALLLAVPTLVAVAMLLATLLHEITGDVVTFAQSGRLRKHLLREICQNVSALVMLAVLEWAIYLLSLASIDYLKG